VRTPRPRANAGRKSAATHQANTPAPSAANNKRTAAPPPVKTAIRTPASQQAGSWRKRIRGEEKSRGLVADRDSRAPIADQIRIGQSHAKARTRPRDALRGATTSAASKPNAIAYHHQR